MSIQKAKQNDLPEIKELLSHLVQQMKQNGEIYWDENYPASKIGKDISNQDLYKLSIGNKICGIIVLNEEEDPIYKTLDWRYEGEILVVHRLAVHPETQKQGIGKQLMRFAEEFAQKNHYTAIRLDTYSIGFMVDFYKKLNYLEVGSVVLNPDLDLFVCLEKEIKQDPKA